MSLTYPSTFTWFRGLLMYRRLAKSMLFSHRRCFEREVERASNVCWPSALLFLTPDVVRQALANMKQQLPGSSLVQELKI